MGMRVLYRKAKASKKRGIVRMHRNKMYLAEWLAIFRKQKLYRDVKWTAQQKQEFDAFWIKHYGKKISPRWHKLYQSINGVFDVKYFPDYLYTPLMELKLNPFLLSEQLQSKVFPELLLQEQVGGMEDGTRVPETYALCYNGYYYMQQRKVASFKEMLKSIADIGEAVIKPVSDSSSGRDVRMVHISEGVDQRSGIAISDILASYAGNFVVQERLRQCEAVNRLYAGAINTFRVITYICGGGVKLAPISLRIGSAGGEVDNIHASGIVIGISEDGYLGEKAFKLGYCDDKETYREHPDSKVMFRGYRIPHVERITRAARRLHGKLPGMGIISWDFILDEQERPVVLETNLLGQSVWFPQIVNGTALFGEHTEEMVAMLAGNQRKKAR